MRKPPGELQLSVVVVSDLDNCLLDAETFRWTPANETLSLMREGAIELVLASSKTRAEMDLISSKLGFDSPLIVENGGAVIAPVSWSGTTALVIPLGVRRSFLIKVLRRAALQLGATVTLLSDCSTEVVAIMTGLSPFVATLALQREYDEPFTLEDRRHLPALKRAAIRKGCRIVDGGRFLHMTGPTNKGLALRELLRVSRPRPTQLTTIAVGDGGNDLELLLEVDIPLIIPTKNGRVEPKLRRSLPNAVIASTPGPVGWNEVVGAALRRLGVA